MEDQPGPQGALSEKEQAKAFWEAEGGQPDLYSNFQTSQYYKVKPCLSNSNNKKGVGVELYLLKTPLAGLGV